MRRITMWILGTVCGLVLLLSYHTSLGGTRGDRGAQHADRDAGGVPTTGTSAQPTAGTSAISGDLFDGKVVQTRHGEVQVRAVISGGELVDVVVLQVPGGNHHDTEINDRAVPLLRKAALAAQSADIDSVSGATVTSKGYRASLQSALDAANFQG
ncbi:MAG: FMN-binding protein [Dactylosporangium sp.]|nr:FMN-binding protein [Dactylosporangium sp.]NNJ60043.1 FMN-binding protein [Dactylosporangium sp.]